MALERNYWLSVRDSGSLGQRLRGRERIIHASKALVFVTGEDGRPQIRVSARPGITRNIGRNARKRADRAGKPRKHWRRVA